jgi:hypothetical protein
MADQIHQSPTTNNKHMINQQVSQENSYWKGKKKKKTLCRSISGDSPENAETSWRTVATSPATT